MSALKQPGRRYGPPPKRPARGNYGRPLAASVRAENYWYQGGWSRFTPRQNRRFNKKVRQHAGSES